MANSEIHSSMWRMRELLNENISFRVPRIQRVYKWEKNEIRDFIDDLIHATNNKSRHYFGAFCTADVSSTNSTHDVNTMIIIDGQQRITTSLLFLKYMEKKVTSEVNKETIKQIFLNTNLQLGKNDNQSFQNILNDETPDTNSNLSNVMKHFEECLNESPTGKNLSSDELVSTLIGKFQMVKILLPKKLISATFQLINNRGKHLDQDELIKSKLFLDLEATETDESVMEDLDRQWMEMLGKLKKNKVQPKVFIQHVLAIKLGSTDREKLFYDFQRDYKKIQRSSFQNECPAKIWLEDLFKWSERYFKLRSPSENLEKIKINGRINAGEWLKRTKDINAMNIYPILLACYCKYYENNDKNSFAKVVDSCYRFHILIRTLGSVKTDGYNKEMEFIAHEIFEDRISKVTDVVDKLMKYKKSVTTLISISQAISNIKPKSARHCLLLIEEHEHGTEKIANTPTLEHILPKNYKKTDWYDYIKNHYVDYNDDYVGTLKENLGNMTLLSNSKNGGVKDHIFDKKILRYKNSDYGITRDVATKLSWTDADIEQKQKEYCKILDEILIINEYHKPKNKL